MNNIKITICFTGFVFFMFQLTCIQFTDARANDIKISSQEKVFQAGAATSNITPPLGGGIIGLFGTPPPATHIHDELHVRCLVLDDGETKLAFVVVDNIGLNLDLIDEAKRLIEDKTDLPKKNVMISATHTHSATRASNREPIDYQEMIILRIADGVRRANNNLEPARIGWGVGSVPQHVFVRRWKMKHGTDVPNPFGGQDKVRMNPNTGDPNLLEPAGEPDPEVSFISVQSVDGRQIALLANYSLHYVGGVPIGYISADYFGVFADRIQELLKADRHDPPFVGIMSNGTSGDVTSTNRLGPSKRYEPYQKMQLVAEDVAQEVLRVYRTIHYHDWLSLQAAQEKLTLQMRKPDSHMIERAKWVLSRPDTIKPVHRHEKVYAERTLRMLDRPDQIDIIMQTFRIGDLGVAAIPFETFAEIGLELKAKNPFKHSFTISFGNGSYGYLPTPEQHELGGYETWLGTNRVEIEASNKIVEKLLGMFVSMKRN